MTTTSSKNDHDFTVSRYKYWIGIEDSAGDEERQLTVAQRVFDAMKDQGWPTMLSRNLKATSPSTHNYREPRDQGIETINWSTVYEPPVRPSRAGLWTHHANRMILVEGDPLPVRLPKSHALRL